MITYFPKAVIALVIASCCLRWLIVSNQKFGFISILSDAVRRDHKQNKCCHQISQRNRPSKKFSQKTV